METGFNPPFLQGHVGSVCWGMKKKCFAKQQQQHRKQTNKTKQNKKNFSESAVTQPCCSLPVEDCDDAGFRPVVNVGEFWCVRC